MNVTALFRKSTTLGVLTILTGFVVGCGVREPDIPKRPPTTAEIKGWSDHRIVVIEKAIQDKDWRLPSRVSGLVRYLRGLEINVTIGPGQRFQNTEEAVDALNRVIAKLDGWFEESLNREKGDSDEDRAKLQAIVNEAKDILKNVKVTEGESR
jgi:hypothetical protein